MSFFERVSPRYQTLHAGLLTIIAASAVAIMAFAAFGDLAKRPDAALAKSDFGAFYCGSVAAFAHADPYAVSPLRECESERVDRPGGADPKAVGIDPDPLPGYAMAFFAPFTVLPYRVAGLCWEALLVAAIVATAALLGSLTGLPTLAIAGLLAFAEGFLSVPYGQMPPVLAFGLTLAAFGLVRERRSLTLIGAGISMLEPHIGLPACAALFVWYPALRPGLLVIVAILTAASVAALGVALNVEYLRIELPAHAAAEATTAIQYSLAWLLHYLGVPDVAAVRLASLQYAVFALAGIALAARVARTFETRAAFVLFPPALALIGGSFVHVQQMAAALPFAVLVAARSTGAAARAAWFAVVLLAVPWPVETRLLLAGAVAIVATAVIMASPSQRLGTVVFAALTAAAVYAAVGGPILSRAVPGTPQQHLAAPGPMPRALSGDRLASEEGAREERQIPAFAVASPRTLAAKIPTWLGLCTIAGLSLGARAVRRASVPVPA